MKSRAKNPQAAVTKPPSLWPQVNTKSPSFEIRSNAITVMIICRTQITTTVPMISPAISDRPRIGIAFNTSKWGMSMRRSTRTIDGASSDT